MITREQMDRKKRKLALREQRQHMVFDFGDLIENRSRGYFHDVKTLPHPKTEILAGLLNAIANSKTRQEVEVYSAAALILAHYQEDIGDRPFTPHDTEGRDPHSFTEAELLVFMERGRQDRKKIDRLNEVKSDDMEFIFSLVTRAKVLNPHLRPLYKRLWDKFRQRGFYSPFSDGFVDAADELLAV